MEQTIDSVRTPFPPLEAAPAELTARDVKRMVREMIGNVADKWTMLVLYALWEHGCLRFTQVQIQVGEVSQRMLTKTLRQMEEDGLVSRTVYAVVPPKVEHELTDLGRSLGEAASVICTWVRTHHQEVEAARKAFAARQDQ